MGVLGDTFILWPACVGFILLLTPTGSLPSPRWRWWARLSAAAPAAYLLVAWFGVETVRYQLYSIQNPLFVPALEPLLVAILPLVVLTLLGVVVGGVSLVVRFRRARGIERQQLRWVAFAAGLAGVAVPVALAGIAVNSPLLVGMGTISYAAVLCLAIGAAILRYRLYDLDRIISRTLAYGLLTVLLGGGYAAGVVGLGQLLPQDSSLVVAGATLGVAGAFRPARRRVQQAVDRRFNRRRYDAARTIQGFSARLRQQVDLDTLTGELLAVVDQTMQPTHAWLWLHPGSPAGAATGDRAAGSAPQAGVSPPSGRV